MKTEKPLLSKFSILCTCIAVVHYLALLITPPSLNTQINSYILYSRVAIDSLFSLLFLLLLIHYTVRKQFMYYMQHLYGWLDFLISVPVLLLGSLPLLYFDLGLSGTLPSNAALLIELSPSFSVLALLRMVKLALLFSMLFSPLRQRQMRMLIALVCCVFIGLIVMYQISRISLGTEDKIIDKQNFITSLLNLEVEERGTEKTVTQIKKNPAIICAEYNSTIIYNQFNLSKQILSANIRLHRISTSTDKALIIYYDNKNSIRERQQSELLYFIIVLSIILSILMIYSKYFSRTILEPVNIMRNGFEKQEYLLLVKIPECYQNDDVFRLAALYNRKWLTAKLLKLEQTNMQKRVPLKFDDIFKDQE